VIDFAGKTLKKQMKNNNIEHRLPESILSKLYDRTGYENGGNKGFYLFYINSNGDPCHVNKFENNAVKMAIEKSIEIMIDRIEEDRIFIEDFELDDPAK